MPDAWMVRVANVSAVSLSPSGRRADRQAFLRQESGPTFVRTSVISAGSNVKDTVTAAHRVDLDEFVLLTMHRAENVDDKKTLGGLVRGLVSLNEHIIFAAHPRTIERLERFGLMKDVRSGGKIHIIDPPGYLEFLALMRDCKYVLTDSGGIQEEVTAPSINKRVFVLRTSTERPEAVDSGHATVVGVDPDRFPALISNQTAEGLNAPRPSPYGDGTASKRIVDLLEGHYGYK